MTAQLSSRLNPNINSYIHTYMHIICKSSQKPSTSSFQSQLICRELILLSPRIPKIRLHGRDIGRDELGGGQLTQEVLGVVIHY